MDEEDKFGLQVHLDVSSDSETEFQPREFEEIIRVLTPSPVNYDPSKIVRISAPKPPNVWETRRIQQEKKGDSPEVPVSSNEKVTSESEPSTSPKKKKRKKKKKSSTFNALDLTNFPQLHHQQSAVDSADRQFPPLLSQQHLIGLNDSPLGHQQHSINERNFDHNHIETRKLLYSVYIPNAGAFPIVDRNGRSTPTDDWENVAEKDDAVVEPPTTKTKKSKKHKRKVKKFVDDVPTNGENLDKNIKSVDEENIEQTILENFHKILKSVNDENVEQKFPTVNTNSVSVGAGNSVLNQNTSRIDLAEPPKTNAKRQRKRKKKVKKDISDITTSEQLENAIEKFSRKELKSDERVFIAKKLPSSDEKVVIESVEIIQLEKEDSSRKIVDDKSLTNEQKECDISWTDNDNSVFSVQQNRNDPNNNDTIVDPLNGKTKKHYVSVNGNLDVYIKSDKTEKKNDVLNDEIKGGEVILSCGEKSPNHFVFNYIQSDSYTLFGKSANDDAHQNQNESKNKEDATIFKPFNTEKSDRDEVVKNILNDDNAKRHSMNYVPNKEDRVLENLEPIEIKEKHSVDKKVTIKLDFLKNLEVLEREETSKSDELRTVKLRPEIIKNGLVKKNYLRYTKQELLNIYERLTDQDPFVLNSKIKMSSCIRKSVLPPLNPTILLASKSNTNVVVIKDCANKNSLNAVRTSIDKSTQTEQIVPNVQNNFYPFDKETAVVLNSNNTETLFDKYIFLICFFIFIHFFKLLMESLVIAFVFKITLTILFFFAMYKSLD